MADLPANKLSAGYAHQANEFKAVGALPFLRLLQEGTPELAQLPSVLMWVIH